MNHLVYLENAMQFVRLRLMIRATLYSCSGDVLHKDAKLKRPVG